MNKKESRQRKKIREFAKSIGFTDIEIEWHPHTKDAEKCGIGGGWSVECTDEYDERYTFIGLNIEDLMRDMKGFQETWR